jgi:hypothetical protein
LFAGGDGAQRALLDRAQHRRDKPAFGGDRHGDFDSIEAAQAGDEVRPKFLAGTARCFLGLGC